jgi:hypothetical protein
MELESSLSCPHDKDNEPFVSCIQFTPSHLKTHLNSSSSLPFCSPLSSRILCALFTSHACYMLSPFQNHCFHRCSNILWRLQIIKILVMQFSPPSCYFILFTSTFISQTTSIYVTSFGKETKFCTYTNRPHRGGPGSVLGLVKWDLWWTKWPRGRFSPSTSVSPANHSTNFSILTITRGRYNRPVSGRRAEWAQFGLHPPLCKLIKKLIIPTDR